jgi:transcriptional regulator with XRE-family HTH domain
MQTKANQPRSLRPLSLKRSATTLRLHHLMEEQQRLEIGRRIKTLRDNGPQTNRSIAEFCDVGERSVANWVAGKGIAWDNAKRVAELFDVEVQWVWTGEERAPTPDLLDALSPGRAEGQAEILERIAELAASVAELHLEVGTIRELLEAKSAARKRSA